MKFAGKTYFWRKGKLELSLPCANSYEQSQLQPKNLYCNQSWKNSITCAKYMWKICVRIGMCYLCTIHIIDAYSSTTKKNASPSMYIGGLYIGGEGRSSKTKRILCLGHLSPKVYTHYVCFSSFLFPGDLHDSLDILWQALATCHQGEAMYIGGLGEGRGPTKKKNIFFPWPPLPLTEAIYIYIHTHYVCFSSFLFPGDLHDSLGILWQPLRKSDNLCGSLAIPSQVYEHK